MTPSLASTRIAFASNYIGHRSHREIYVMNPDGTGQLQCTHNPASSWHPVWSPDGTKIAYMFHDSHPQIYVMNADGTTPRPLTNDTANHGGPTWSPDSQHIAWHCKHTGAPAAIYAMNADGTDRRRLTQNSSGGDPAWSPDGTKIAFMSNRDGHQELYVMNADGTDQTRLTCTAARHWHPAWSPDGTKIACVSDRDGHQEIYVMNADGTHPTRLTQTAARNTQPAWSPDGTRIVFRSRRDDHGEIYVMNADGTDQTRLTYDPSDKSHPSWSPFLPDMTPNTLQFMESFASPEGQALVAVRLHTNQPLSRLQFAVQPTIDGIPTTNALFTGLINNMAHEGLIATFATDPAGMTIVLLFSPTDTPLPPGGSTVLHLAYDLSPETLAGTVIHLHVTDDVFSAPSRETIPHVLQTGRIFIGRPGDVVGGPLGLGDGRIDAEDVRAAVDLLLGNRPSPRYGTLEFFVADVNGDDTIDILDVVEIVNLSLGGAVKRQRDRPSVPVRIGLGPVKRRESGHLALTVMLESDSILAGLQLTITYTSTQLEVGQPQAVGQAARMEVASALSEEPATEPAPIGTLKVVLYSPTGQVIAPGRETILMIPVTVLREPSPMFPVDTVDLLDLTIGSTCQAQRVPLSLMEAAWMTVSAVPFRTTLLVNQPDPFKHVTQILYELESTETVTIGIYTLQGQEMIRLVEGRQGPGRYGVRWYGQDRHGAPVPIGDYLCRMMTSRGCTEMPIRRRPSAG